MSVVTRGFFFASMSTTSVDFWDVVFVFYGMAPFLVPMAIVSSGSCNPEATACCACSHSAFTRNSSVNSTVIMQILDDCGVGRARPSGSCLSSKKMPSDHATTAADFLKTSIFPRLYRL
ncbi:hypothetical protein Gpo141_00012309 [Globisporangium polare]